jgi:hypothetical protein
MSVVTCWYHLAMRLCCVCTAFRRAGLVQACLSAAWNILKTELDMALSKVLKHHGDTNPDVIVVVGQLHCLAISPCK